MTRWLLPGLCSLLFPLTAFAGQVNIAILSNGYGDLARFRSDASTVQQALLAREPFKTRATQFAFTVVENTTDLKCVHAANMDRLITCDQAAAKAMLLQRGIAYHKGIILVDDWHYGGSGGGDFAVSYNGTQMREVVVHEFGHSFGGLLDEYLLLSTDSWMANRAEANCWSGVPPASWTPTPFKECRSPGWYRPNDCSLMRALGCLDFNAVSQALLTTRIDQIAGAPIPQPTVDVTPPTVQIVTPTNGQVITGQVKVSVTAADNVKLARIELYSVDVAKNLTRLRASSATGTLTYTWHIWSRSYSHGELWLIAKAYDVQGNVSEVTVSITKP